MHLSDRALLVHLGVSQWVARKLDRKASNEIARINGADNRAGNYNKSLLPSCDLLDAVKQETASIRKDFYRNTLPWGIEGTFILPSANYLPFMAEYRGKKAVWERLVTKFLAGYGAAQQDAERLLGSLYAASNYPSQAEMAAKFSMDLSILPVPSAGDFRVELADGEIQAMQADIEERVAQSSAAAVRDVWSRLYDKITWLHGRLADPKTTFHDETYKDAQDLVRMLTRLNFTDDPELETLRQEAEQNLFRLHPQALRNDPVVRRDTATEAKAIMDKMSVFMGKLA